MCNWISISANAAIINFNDYVIESYVAGQDLSGTSETSTDGTQLSLTGNLWKSINEAFTITSDTILKFDFMSTVEGEISAIGFDNEPVTVANTSRFFQLAGTDSRYGIQAFNNYDIGDGLVSYTIDVGSFFTGTFDTLFFVMDDDSSQTTSNATFLNVEICNVGSCLSDLPSVEVPEPSLIGYLAALMLTFVSVRKKITK